MDGVRRVSRGGAAVSRTSSADHRRVQKSTTLNRKFVKKPAAKPKVVKSTTNSAMRAAAAMPRRSAQRQLIQRQQGVRLRPTAATQTQQAKATGIKSAAAKKAVAAPAIASVKAAGIKKAVTPQAELAAMAAKRQAVSAKQQKAPAKAAVVAKAKTRQQAQQQGRQQVNIAQVAKARMAARKAPAPTHLSAQELKDRAIQQALRRVATAEKKDEFVAAETQKARFWQKKKLWFVGAVAVAAVVLLGYLVHLNLPDLSVRVAAMQAGIEKVYPSYIPSNYKLDGLAEETDGKVQLRFKNDLDQNFTLTAEKSSWDSAAVLSNFVKKNWGEDYAIAKGQGLTIYISQSKAVWVNGGVLYVIDGEAAKLNSNDLHDIAVSL